MKEKSGVAALPELTEFDVTHLEITDLIFLNASRKEIATWVAELTTVDFPNQKIVMRLVRFQV